MPTSDARAETAAEDWLALQLHAVDYCSVIVLWWTGIWCNFELGIQYIIRFWVSTAKFHIFWCTIRRKIIGISKMKLNLIDRDREVIYFCAKINNSNFVVEFFQANSLISINSHLARAHCLDWMYLVARIDRKMIKLETYCSSCVR